MSSQTPDSPTYDPRKEFGRAVAEVAEANERVVVISTDSGKSSGFGDFLKAHPERYFEVGIEEQGATGMAAGLATTGKIPVFCAIAPFVTARNYEQFRNDIGYMEQNVKIVGRNGGMTYADLGSTHHSLEDFAIVRMIPGVTILAPQDYSEIRAGVKAMIEHDGPVYMRIGAGNVPVLFEEDFEIGKGRYVRRGSQVTIVSAGYQTIETMKAVDALVADGIDVDLICLGTIVPLDEQLVLESARRTGHVITVEEHYDRGGLGGIVSELIAHEGGAVVDIIAVPHTFVHTGTYAGLQQQHGLDAASLRTRITDLVARRATP